MTDTAILQGIRVLDMTSVIFGPYCTATLAEMGAEVIKIEPGTGDEIRRVGKPRFTRGMGPAHMTLNRGKRSVVWDLKSADGQERLRRLLSRCDVFIHNLRSDALARLGLDYDSVKAVREDIVVVHCTGFGSDGPYAGRAAYDDIIQAASGAASLLSRTDGNPQPRFLPMAMADKVSGLHAVYAVLGAVLHRQRTGRGQAVEVPMFECFTHFLLQDHLYGRAFVPPQESVGYPRQLDPQRQPIKSLDGYLSIAPYTDERWVRFFEITGHSDFLQRECLNSPRERFRGLDLMQAKMARMVAEHSSEYWLELLARHDIPACRVNDLEDLFSDPHLAATAFFREREHPSEGRYLEMRSPVRFSGADAEQVSAAPLLGEHTEEVNRWLVDQSTG